MVMASRAQRSDVIVRTAMRAALAGMLTALFAATAAAGADHGCSYAATGEMRQVEHCASLDAAGQVHLKHDVRAALHYDANGLASVYIDGGGWHYLTRDGRAAPVMSMDNGADPFVDGRARSPVGGKIGFIDRHLVLVIPARYDGALPFEGGRAEVCIGCTLAPEGEHSAYVGGRWGCIDRHGRERGPLTPAPGAGHACRKGG